LKSASLLLIIGLAICLVGCASSEGGDGGTETSTVEAKQKLDSNMSKEDQDQLATRVKAWDPKKDKK